METDTWLTSVERRVDCVIEVRHENTTHCRHLELYLFPPGPADEELAFGVVLQGREVNVWRFQVVRLWRWRVGRRSKAGRPGCWRSFP